MAALCDRCGNAGEGDVCCCGSPAWELGTIVASYDLWNQGSGAYSYRKVMEDIAEAKRHVMRRMQENRTAERGRAPLRGSS